MKIKYFIITCALLILTEIQMSGCKKNSNLPVGVTIMYNSNDPAWVASSYSATVDTDTVYNIVYLNIAARGTTSSGPDEYDITIPYFKYTIGTYNLDHCIPCTSASIFHNSFSPAYASSGSLSLTQVSSNNVQGIFDYVYVNGSNSSINGTFNIPITH